MGQVLDGPVRQAIERTIRRRVRPKALGLHLVGSSTMLNGQGEARRSQESDQTAPFPCPGQRKKVGNLGDVAADRVRRGSLVDIEHVSNQRVKGLV